jgi:hypothetical protein
VVQVTLGKSIGTGFFIAPGWVLTCAHVVAGAPVEAMDQVTLDPAEPAPIGPDNQPRIRRLLSSTRTRDYQGTVRAVVPSLRGDSKTWLPPDIALVQVTMNGEPSPAVWLTEDPPRHGNHLTVTGFGRIYSSGVEPITIQPEVKGTHRLGDYAMVRMAHEEISDGMSGAPVLDLDLGGVCGFVKASRADGAGSGGIAVPIQDALAEIDPQIMASVWRAHDLYHAEDNSWTSLAAALPMNPASVPVESLMSPTGVNRVLEPGWTAELRGILAELRVSDLNAIYIAACEPNRPNPGRPLQYLRDLVTELNDVAAGPRGTLHPLLVLTELMTELTTQGTDQTSRELRRWSNARAALWGQQGPLTEYRQARTLASPPSPPLTDPMSVMVEIRRHAFTRRKYLLTMWLYRGTGDVELFYRSDGPQPIAHVRADLKDLLLKALRRLDTQRSLMVELILEEELFDEDVDSWPIWPAMQQTRLGRRHAVTVKPIETFDEPERRHDQADRWSTLNSGREIPDSAIQRIHCTQQVQEEALDGWLREEPGHSVLLLPGPAGVRSHRTALQVGISAGLPVALWRRRPCMDHDGTTGNGECSGARFIRNLTRELSRMTVQQLPERVRGLRTTAAQAQDSDHCGHQVVVLWDPPERRLGPGGPLIPLAAPDPIGRR